MGVIDRSRGALLGLAVGDALGAAVEFKAPGTFEPVIGFRGGGPHGLSAGQWTDDTSMALALADSLTRAGWDLNDQADRYLAWSHEGRYSVNGRCFDIGMTVSGALRNYRHTGDAWSAASTDEYSSGNGSIMRLAPVPIRFAYLFPTEIQELGRLAAESSLPTHASEQCLSACRYMTVVLAGLINGVAREEVLSADWEPIRTLIADRPFHPALNEIAKGSFRTKDDSEIRGSGYVMHCLEAALWSFHNAVSFEEAVLRAVNLGDDADTTGAVCGQLAGAYWGRSGIPQLWLDQLDQPEMIDEALDGLLGFGQITDSEHEPAQDTEEFLPLVDPIRSSEETADFDLPADDEFSPESDSNDPHDSQQKLF